LFVGREIPRQGVLLPMRVFSEVLSGPFAFVYFCPLWDFVTKLLRFFLVLFVLLWASSCTLLTHSSNISKMALVPVLDRDRGLLTSESGEVPYQRWRVPPWDEDMRFIWLVGNYDFRRFDNVELVLYFHGMHSKDYYSAFRKELELLVAKRPKRPFLFVGFVDTPLMSSELRGKERWSSLTIKEGETPELLFKTVNRIFRGLRHSFPQIRKDKAAIVLAGFSGGGRVLSSVGNWLARSPKDDLYADVFRSRLTKIVYFDCWFDKDVIETIPALLEDNPDMKIVGTVHMNKPLELAAQLAGRFKMKANPGKKELVGLDGRLTIFRDESHWNAMISRLKEAL